MRSAPFSQIRSHYYTHAIDDYVFVATSTQLTTLASDSDTQTPVPDDSQGGLF